MISIQSKKKQNIYLFLILIFSSILINKTYYFNHDALLSALVINNNNLYIDESNLFFIAHNSSPSFLFNILSFLINRSVSIEAINESLTFISIFFNLTGIYLISKLITSSTTLSILISLTTILLEKNFGNLDYPTLMFSGHTSGLIAYSLCTFIFGLLTLRNNFYAIFFTLLLLSIHLVIGTWMLGLLILFIFFNKKEKNKNNIIKIILISLIITVYYLSFSFDYKDLPFEFNQKDYDDYFTYIEAHRTNYGNLKDFHYEYITWTIILFTLLLLLIFFDFSDEKIINYLKILIASIFFSFLIYLTYKLFPQIFPDFIIRMIPQRFFLIHSVIGFPIIISIIYKLINILIINKKIKKNYSYYFIMIVLITHLIQHNDRLYKKIENINLIKNEKKNEYSFWKKVRELNLDGYVLTSNYLCKKTLIYSKLPLLFCFESIDYIPYFKKLATPTKIITQKILEIPYSDLKYKNVGGISEYDLKKIYENKNLNNWKKIKDEFGLNTVIVPKDWNLNINNLILNDKYKVYVIK